MNRASVRRGGFMGSAHRPGGAQLTGLIMLIDAHTHAFLPEDMKLLGERLSLLDAGLDSGDPNKWQIFLPGDIESLLAAEKACGVDRMVLLPVSGKPERCRELNRWAAQSARNHPEIIPFGILHPAGPWREELALLLEHGLKGVKLHPMIQRFSLADPATCELLGAIAGSGLPVLVDTMYLPGMYRYKPHVKPIFRTLGYDSCTPDQVAGIARSLPGLKIIAAHAGALYGWDKIEPLYELDNVYLDISCVNGILTEDGLLEIIRKKGADKVLYGSDAPWRPPEEFKGWYESLALSMEERRLISSRNLLKLLGEA